MWPGSSDNKLRHRHDVHLCLTNIQMVTRVGTAVAGIDCRHSDLLATRPLHNFPTEGRLERRQACFLQGAPNTKCRVPSSMTKGDPWCLDNTPCFYPPLGAGYSEGGSVLSGARVPVRVLLTDLSGNEILSWVPPAFE